MWSVWAGRCGRACADEGLGGGVERVVRNRPLGVDADAGSVMLVVLCSWGDLLRWKWKG